MSVPSPPLRSSGVSSQSPKMCLGLRHFGPVRSTTSCALARLRRQALCRLRRPIRRASVAPTQPLGARSRLWWGAHSRDDTGSIGLSGVSTRANAFGLEAGASLIAAEDTWSIWLVLLSGASFGLWAARTRVGRALSGPVCAMLFVATLSNLSVLPPPGPSIAAIQGTVVKMATPLLLFGADLRLIFRETGRLLQSFTLGTFAVVVGGILAFGLVSESMNEVGILAAVGSSTWLPSDGWKVASALLAKNIGGGINYIAVATTLSISPTVIAAGITVDNIFALLYFPLVGALGNLRETNEAVVVQPVHELEAAPKTTHKTTIQAAMSSSSIKESSVDEMCLALTLAVGLVLASQTINSTASIPICTALAVIGATAFPKKVGKLAPAGDMLGKLFLYIFFATAGASGGKLSTALSFTPIFQFLGILYLVHLMIMLAAWRITKCDLAEILVASNANIGGPATASALAVGKGWTHLVGPGLLVGSLGNAYATFIGLGVGTLIFSRF